MQKNPDNLIWIDLEMTGLEPERCHILEIATVLTTSDLEVIAEGPNLVIHATEAELETLSDWSREHFTASGLLDRVRTSTVRPADAEARTLEFVREHVRRGEAPLCGNSVHTDRAFLRRHMRELHDHLHYRNVDVSTFKECLRRWYPTSYDPPAKAGRHEARTDILESIAELRYYRETFLVPPRAGDGLHFGHVEVPSADVARSAAFYRDALGFQVVSEQGPYVWVARDGLEILLRPAEDVKGHGLVWYTSEPARVARELDARGVKVEHRKNCYHLQDPDGHDIQIVDPQADHS